MSSDFRCSAEAMQEDRSVLMSGVRSRPFENKKRIGILKFRWWRTKAGLKNEFGVSSEAKDPLR